jgi:ankyrin repeat protein
MTSDSTCQWLRENGFDPQHLEQPGQYEDMPIILASRRGEAAIVDELLAAGVNVNHHNMDGTNALSAVRGRCHTALTR